MLVLTNICNYMMNIQIGRTDENPLSGRGLFLCYVKIFQTFLASLACFKYDFIFLNHGSSSTYASRTILSSLPSIIKNVRGGRNCLFFI